jgi:AbrB family looped-hinge helix DNA binding protein
MPVTAKVTSKGQITLPKEVRKLLSVRKGSVVVFERENNRIVIKPAMTLKEFKGLLKGKGKKIDFDEIRKRAKEYIGKKVAHGG